MLEADESAPGLGQTGWGVCRPSAYKAQRENHASDAWLLHVITGYWSACSTCVADRTHTSGDLILTWDFI